MIPGGSGLKRGPRKLFGMIKITAFLLVRLTLFRGHSTWFFKLISSNGRGMCYLAVDSRVCRQFAGDRALIYENQSGRSLSR